MAAQGIVLCHARRGVRLPTPGQTALYDYEYKRNGTANVFMLVEPWTAGAK
jgi:hypothetical protein